MELLEEEELMPSKSLKVGAQMAKIDEAPRNSRTYSEAEATNSERRASFSERQNDDLHAEIII